MMSELNEYVMIERTESWEVGFGLVGEPGTHVIAVIVFNHKKFSVRLAGLAESLEDAFKIYFDCINELRNVAC